MYKKAHYSFWQYNGKISVSMIIFLIKYFINPCPKRDMGYRKTCHIMLFGKTKQQSFRMTDGFSIAKLSSLSVHDEIACQQTWSPGSSLG